MPGVRTCGRGEHCLFWLDKVVPLKHSREHATPVLVAFSKTRRRFEQSIFYFPGDIQNLEEFLDPSTSDVHELAALEATAETLLKKYSDSLIWIFRAAELRNGTFAVYKNLLKATGDTGAAEYSNYGKCCDILLDLEQVVQDMLIETCENSPCGNFMLQAEDIVHIDKLPIRMLGFSKGVVIVNQVLLELSRAGREQNKFGDSVNPSTIRWSGGVSSGIELGQRLKSITWLDGGNGPYHGSFVFFSRHPRNNFELHIAPLMVSTNEPLLFDTEQTQNALEFLPKHIDFHIFVTPYQMCVQNCEGKLVSGPLVEELRAFVKCCRSRKEHPSPRVYLYYFPEGCLSDLQDDQPRCRCAMSPRGADINEGKLHQHFQLLVDYEEE
eukprot:CAMPEP_0113876824 /NCGR_PEP_ID=MMETSP0780_2-20120614/5709_1 /TAXON_ID=652834 /ORGANISM="Palpitomonas bilix" /LENGTH=381 /DNA_ID=CAMNT_0000862961 /DNA_START=73 /DNA_END=1221 /DNA_ORIENTATION=- /assembly_acc=CAM_ASM_000599